MLSVPSPNVKRQVKNHGEFSSPKSLPSFSKEKPLKRWQWRRPGSNRQPPACKAGALPIELHPHLGVRGFEPRTSALSELRSNQLSYTPSDETLKGFGPKRRMLKIFFSKFKWTRHRKTILRHQAAYSATFFVFFRPNGNAYKDISAGLDEREVSSIFNLSELQRANFPRNEVELAFRNGKSIRRDGNRSNPNATTI